MEKENNSDLALVMCPAWGAVQPPAGIGYLKGFLKKKGIFVKNFDFNLELYKIFPEKEYWDLNYPEYFIMPALFEKKILPFLRPYINIWAEQVLSCNPKVVGFSLFMSSINASILLAKKLKELRPELLILGGGPEATRLKRVIGDGIRQFAALNKEILTGNIFDGLINGEGEEALWEILLLTKQERDFHDVRGLFYLSNGKVIVNPERGLLKSLDELPSADYQDFDLKDYTKKTLPLVTSRGCVNRCSFCADSPLWKIYRFRSAEKVLDEIKILTKQYMVNEFEIIDSTFNGEVKRVDRICDLVIKDKLNIRWSAKATLRKEMSLGLLKKMKKAGCVSLSYGVESGSPRILADMCKNINLDEAVRIIRDTCGAGILVNCFFIVGYPIESEDDFQMTLNFIQANIGYIHRLDQITGCHIEEDSCLGLNLDKYGIIFKEDGWHSRFSTPVIRKERLEKIRELAGKLHNHYQCEVQA